MDIRVYWIWLQQALGVGARESEAVLKAFHTAKAVYEADTFSPALGLTAEQLRRLADHDTAPAQALLRDTLRAGAWLLTPDDMDYPSLLRGIYAPPVVLYGKGNCLRLDQLPTIAVVGTRHYSDEGRLATAKLAAGLAAGGAVVVSGGAEGLDSAALTAAMDAGGVCVSFQACGIDVEYPIPTMPVRRRLLENGGMLLSEFPLGLPALKHHFRIRNRLISGLSLGTCVTEAPDRSGALMTAHWAREQGREVYVLPGAVTNRRCEGSNRLIKDGARLITHAADVLMDYVTRFPQMIDMEAAIAAEEKAVVSPPLTAVRSKPPAKKRQVPPAAPVTVRVAEPIPSERPECPQGVTDEASTVFAALDWQPQAADALARKTMLPLAKVLAALTELELYGAVRCTAGQQYVLPVSSA